MKRDGRIEFRVPEGSKRRWEGAAEGLGYPSLSAFIVDTIEQVHFASATGAVADVVPIDVKSAAPLGATGETHSQGEEDSLASPPPPVELVVATTGKPIEAPVSRIGTCPNFARHRKGVFCKSCKKVI
jgi:hypothetical protein